MSTTMHLDLIDTDTDDLRNIAAECKTDAKALADHNRDESMRLFRLFRRCSEELYRRERLAISAY